MNKKEMIEEYAHIFDLTKVESKRELNRFGLFIQALLMQGETVRFKNLGIFSTQKMGRKTLKMPDTGRIIDVGSYTRPTFAFSDNLKKRIREQFKE